MKDDKNTVFALNSFVTSVPQRHGFTSYANEPEVEFSPRGFLLFETEEKADIFLQMCEDNNKVRKTTDYTKHGYVEVSDFIANRVEAQRQFYVSRLEDHPKEIKEEKNTVSSNTENVETNEEVNVRKLKI